MQRTFGFDSAERRTERSASCSELCKNIPSGQHGSEAKSAYIMTTMCPSGCSGRDCDFMTSTHAHAPARTVPAGMFEVG